jgi:predicted MFS family arabinose efflux permease
MQNIKQGETFTRYEKFVIAILTFIQFTVILDFMVLSPLGTFLMPALSITPKQFSAVVAAYAISAGISGFAAAGFADRFDRKKMLIFFYSGFVVGTLLCGLAGNYHFLLGARIFTGIFGGVISSISFAIVTDLFKMEVRGRVMGFLQMAFAGSQVLGIPIGLYLTSVWDWHSSFLMIVTFCVPIFFLILFYLRPVDQHLSLRSNVSPFKHLILTLKNKEYLKGFAATILLATGGFMLMPFGSDYSRFNLGIDKDSLFQLYMITGVASMITGPFVGRLADAIGKFKVFILGTILTIAVVLFYCNLGVTPFWGVVLISIFMFTGVSARMISSQALLTAVPAPKDRGAFMGINASIQQVSGGIASLIAGLIVVKSSTGKLENYDWLGYVVTGSMIVTMIMMNVLNNMIKHRPSQAPVPPVKNDLHVEAKLS